MSDGDVRVGRVRRLWRWVRSRHPAVQASLGVCGVGAGVLVGVAAWVGWIVAGGPALPALPAGAGAVGEGYWVEDVDGVPVLWVHGEPCPTDPEQTSRRRVSLSGTWEIALDPGEEGPEGLVWEECVVPSTHDAVEGVHPDYDGVAWFRRRFDWGGSTVGTRARLVFRGVLLRCSVWVDGEHKVDHEGGYTPLYVPLEGLEEGEHEVVVRTDDRPTYTSLPPKTRAQHRHGWGQYGGIYRDVYLEEVPRVSLVKLQTGVEWVGETVRVRVDAVLRAAAAGEGEVELWIADPAGVRVAGETRAVAWEAGLSRVSAVLEVPEAQRWSPAAPVLYALGGAVRGEGQPEDRVVVRTGWRTVEATPDGLRLNGEALRLRGIAKHEDHPTFGATQPEALRESDLDRIEAMHANFVRLSHYPHSVESVRAARDRGLLLCEEVPLYQAGMGWLGWLGWDRTLGDVPSDVYGLRHLHDRGLLEQAQRQLIELIERDRHNPAVILWMVSNESYSLGEGAEGVYEWLREVVRAFDTTRPVTAAELTFGTAWLDDRRRASAAMDVASINMYFGWYFGAAADAGPSLDRVRARFPEVPIVVTECGAGSVRGRTVSDGVLDVGGVPVGQSYAESEQARILDEVYEAAWARPFVTGFSPWVYADFRCPWFPRNPIAGYNLKGVMTRERDPKDAYRLLQRRYAED